MEKEIWKEIDKMGSQYLISNKGRVLSFGNNASRKTKILKAQKTSQGYLTVRLFGKQYYIHRLVAKAFLENPDNLPEVHHLDNDKNNNKVENLKWMKHKNIMIRCNKLKYVDKEYCKKEILQLNKNDKIIEKHLSIRDASKKLKIDYRSISKVCNGYRKTAGGYKFSFTN